MALRLARPADAGAVADVLQASRATAMPWLAVVHDDADVRGWVAGVLLATCEVLVVDEGGQVLAVSARAGDVLEQLYVAPQAQGRGLGRALLQQAQAGRDRLELWTFARNARARRFYATAGFVEVEHTDGSGNEEREPDVRLVWERPAAGRVAG